MAREVKIFNVYNDNKSAMEDWMAQYLSDDWKLDSITTTPRVDIDGDKYMEYVVIMVEATI